MDFAQDNFKYDELVQIDFCNEEFNEDFPKNLTNDLIDILKSAPMPFQLTLTNEVRGFIDDFNAFLELYEASEYRNNLLGYEYSKSWSNEVKRICNYF